MTLRQLSLFAISFLVHSGFLHAQSDTIPVSAVIHANNIRATVWSNGLLFSDGEAGAFFPGYTEQGPNISPIRAAGLWMSHIDPGGGLFTDIVRKSDGSNDFVPGAVRKTPGSFILQHQDFNRIWKVTKEDILTHIHDYQDNGVIDNPIPAIFAWPGRKNWFFETYNDGMELPESIHDIAPFWEEYEVDSQYDPDKGDYPFPTVGLPDFGLPSEMLWFSFHGTNEGGVYPGVQINCCVYAYECGEDEILSNTIFVDYQLRSKVVEEMCTNMGIWADVSIGCSDDDYMGTARDWYDIVYAYNSDNEDEACGNQSGYGENPPALGISWIRTPYCIFCGNICNSSSFKSTSIAISEGQNIPPGQHFPTSEWEIYRYLTGDWRDGSPLFFGGSGYQQVTDVATHIFTGDVDDLTTWTEISANRPPGKRQLLSAFGPFEVFPDNGGYHLGTVAFTFARGPGHNHLENIKILRDSMRYFETGIVDPGYDYPVCTTPMPVSTVETAPNAPEILHIFPNPATNTIGAKAGGKQIRRITLLDGFGKPVLQSDALDDAIQVGHLSPGLYLVKAEIEDGSVRMGKVIVMR